MKKTTILKIAFYLIIVIVFNVCFFNLIQDFTPARWINYAAIHLSYLLLCASTLSYDPSKPAGSAVHVYPKIMVAGGYFIVTLLAGVFLIVFLKGFPVIPILVHGLLIGFYLFHYIILMYAEEHTAANELRNKQEVFFLKDCMSRLDLIMDEAPSWEIRKKVESFKFAIKGASQTLIPEVKELEDKIKEAIDRVKEAVKTNDSNLDGIIKDGIAIVKERERIINLKR